MMSITSVVFLLLVFFLLIALLGQSALFVKLPEAKGLKMSAEKVYVAVSTEGKYYINKKEVPKSQVESDLKDLFKSNPSPSFVIAADKGPLHKDAVYFLMDIANRNNYRVRIADDPKTFNEKQTQNKSE